MDPATFHESVARIGMSPLADKAPSTPVAVKRTSRRLVGVT